MTRKSRDMSAIKTEELSKKHKDIFFSIPSRSNMEITEEQLATLNGSTVEQQSNENGTRNSSETEKMCNGCKMEIASKLVMKVSDHFWHQECMTCSDCGERLEQKCFSRDGMIFCSQDFYRRFGPKCPGCNDIISPTHIVRKLNNRVYHISCMCCMACNKQLATGDKFYLLEDGRVICKEDYAEKDPISDANQERTKRARTFISTSQLSSLKLAYCATPKPTLPERERIAKETGLDMRVVQVWFQNRRAKDRRIMNKGRFPWLQTANRRARHMRSQSWSPGVSRFSGMTEEEELDDLNDLHRIKEEVSANSINSLLQNNKILMNKYQPDSPGRFPEESLIAQNNSLQTQMGIQDPRMMYVGAPRMAGDGLVSQVNFDCPANIQNRIEGNVLNNRTLYKDIPNGTPFNQNLPFWPDNLDEEFNYPNQDMNTAQENMTSQFMQQSLDNRIQQAQGVQRISRNF